MRRIEAEWNGFLQGIFWPGSASLPRIGARTGTPWEVEKELCSYLPHLEIDYSKPFSHISERTTSLSLVHGDNIFTKSNQECQSLTRSWSRRVPSADQSFSCMDTRLNDAVTCGGKPQNKIDPYIGSSPDFIKSSKWGSERWTVNGKKYRTSYG